MKKSYLRVKFNERVIPIVWEKSGNLNILKYERFEVRCIDNCLSTGITRIKNYFTFHEEFMQLGGRERLVDVLNRVVFAFYDGLHKEVK